MSVEGSEPVTHFTSTAWKLKGDLSLTSKWIFVNHCNHCFPHLGHGVQLSKELGADGEGVTAPEGEHLPGVPEAGAHHDGLVAVLLVVTEDLPDTLYPGVFLGILIGLSGLGLTSFKI